MSRQRLKSEDRKGQIKQAALEIFIDKGFSKTTMDDIVKRALISKGGLYHHYGNKEEIFKDLMEDGMYYRESVIKAYMEKNKNLSKEDLLVNLLLDKMFDTNPYKTLYVVLLREMSTNSKLRGLYEKVVLEQKKIFFNFCEEIGIKEYRKMTGEVWMFFINTMMMGAGLIEEDEEEKVRSMLSVMLKAYMKEECII